MVSAQREDSLVSPGKVDPIAAEEEFGSGAITVRSVEYSAVVEANESDHKPVFSTLCIDYAIINQV